MGAGTEADAVVAPLTSSRTGAVVASGDAVAREDTMPLGMVLWIRVGGVVWRDRGCRGVLAPLPASDVAVGGVVVREKGRKGFREAASTPAGNAAIGGVVVRE